MAIVKSSKNAKKKEKSAKPASKAKRRRVRIQRATVPVPKEIFEPGPPFPGAVEILLEGRNR